MRQILQIPHRLRRWLGAQIDEIASDRVLRLYGATLAAAHLLSFFHWEYRRAAPLLLDPSAFAVCWPFFESCAAWRWLPREGWEVLLWTLAALSLASAAGFASRRTTSVGYWLLAAATALRLAILVQDFQLRLNQHYMLTWVVAVFLLLPRRRDLLQHLLVLFYFWAGLLKLDYEWLSGAALYGKDRIWIPASLIPASCVYVVVLEVVLIFGVYSRRAWLFWATLAQLAVFHVISWKVVGFFYPTLMFLLLSIFPATRLLTPREAWPRSPLASLRSRGASLRESRVALALAASFSICQLVPYAMPGDSALTGEGRLFALHMFDAQVECEPAYSMRFADGSTRPYPTAWLRNFPRRIRCDPILFLNAGRHLCERLPRPFAEDIDVRVLARRASDPTWHTLIDVERFCAAGLTYDLWRPNAWIRR